MDYMLLMILIFMAYDIFYIRFFPLSLPANTFLIP